MKIQVHESMRLDVSQSGIEHFLVFMTRENPDRNLPCKASILSLEYDVVYGLAELLSDFERDTCGERIGLRCSMGKREDDLLDM